MEQRGYQFMDRTGCSEPRWQPVDPVIIGKEAIRTEIERLAGLPAPENGRRVSQICHPDTGVGNGLAPGTAVFLCVLKPGERTRPIRHNSSLVNFCIQGEGHSIINGKRIDFTQYDVWNTPSWTRYEYANDSDSIQVRLTYSNSPLLEKLQVHIVDEEPSAEDAAGPPEEPSLAADKVNPFGTFRLTEDGAYLMPYEQLISPKVIRCEALHWPWEKVKAELDKLKALGKSYVGRRLYLLYHPATGRTNGITYNFFATITIRPANISDKLHRHISSAINYFFSGKGYSFVNGKRYEWRSGDLMLTAPGWAVHAHNSYDEDVYELTIQDSPLHIAMGSLMWQEDLEHPPEILGATGGFRTNREVKVG